MKNNPQPHNQTGFTLVEILVAMSIALIVMGGVYRTLVDENVNHDRSEKILDMQNNARVAMTRITRDIRRTGSLGCGGNLAASTLANSVTTDTTFIQQLTSNPPSPDPLHWSATKPILSTVVNLALGGANVNFVSEVMGFSDNATVTNDLYQEGTDALTLVYLSEERGVAAPMGALPTDSFAISSQGYDKEDILYVTDCQDFSLFQKTNDFSATVKHQASTGLNTADVDLGKNYGNESAARVFKLNTATYFIHKGKHTLNLNISSAPLASNIEDLQFEFLADENANDNLGDDPWRTNLALYPTGARAVRAVRVWVLAMSDTDYTYTDTNTYDYPNSPYCSEAATYNCSGIGSPATLAPITSPSHGEHRHRYLASAVILLRNAGLATGT